MKLDNIVSVTGLPGLYKLVASRPNGLLIEALDNKKRQFVSARKHQFTPLVSVGIYTYMDTIGLDEVLLRVHAADNANPNPDPNEKADVLRAWFKSIVSDHDEDKVHINDIRKLLKWYTALKTYVWHEIHSEDKEEAEEKDEVKTEEE